MKKILIIAILLYGINGISQKVDIDNYKFYVEYAKLPIHKIDPQDRTFTVQTSGSSDSDLGVIADGITIRGWEYKEEGAKALVKLDVSSFVQGEPDIKKETEVKKNKAGEVTSRNTYYTASSTNFGNAKLTINGPTNKYAPPLSEKDKKRKKENDKKKNDKKKEEEATKAANPFLKNVDIQVEEETVKSADLAGTYNLSKSYSVTSGKKGSKSAAFRAFDAMSGSSFTNNSENFYSTLSSRATTSLNSLYGFSRKRDYVKFKRLDSEKHPEFGMFDNATVAMKEILSKKRFNKSHDEVMEALTPIIDYFISIQKKYSQDKKHPKRLKAAAMYNLAQIYLYMDMPDEAIAIGKEYIRWDHDKKDGEKFIEKGESLKHLLDFHGTKRFFSTEEDADKIESDDEANDGQ